MQELFDCCRLCKGKTDCFQLPPDKLKCPPGTDEELVQYVKQPINAHHRYQTLADWIMATSPYAFEAYPEGFPTYRADAIINMPDRSAVINQVAAASTATVMGGMNQFHFTMRGEIRNLSLSEAQYTRRMNNSQPARYSIAQQLTQDYEQGLRRIQPAHQVHVPDPNTYTQPPEPTCSVHSVHTEQPISPGTRSRTAAPQPQPDTFEGLMAEGEKPENITADYHRRKLSVLEDLEVAIAADIAAEQTATNSRAATPEQHSSDASDAPYEPTPIATTPAEVVKSRKRRKPHSFATPYNPATSAATAPVPKPAALTPQTKPSLPAASAPQAGKLLVCTSKISGDKCYIDSDHQPSKVPKVPWINASNPSKTVCAKCQSKLQYAIQRKKAKKN